MKIGLEIHIQLPTKSKLFCSCNTKAEEPNSSICPICLGHPGTKPNLNENALLLAIKISKALNCTFNKKIWFSRKTYFYPDMSKNYQITQYECPLGYGGYILIDNKKIRISRVQIEEDPASLIHDLIPSQDHVLIDYNRSGIPLVEIVTEPDIESPSMARNLLKNLIAILEYIDIKIKKDHLIKADLNISMDTERVEIKNVNGLKNVENALSYEALRQKKMLKDGKNITRETRHYNSKQKRTFPIREKEFEEDYGYIFEPDLPIFEINDLISNINIPELPNKRIERLVNLYSLNFQELSELVLDSKKLTDFFEKIANEVEPSLALHWIKTNLKTELIEKTNDELYEITDVFIKILMLLSKNIISDVTARDILKEYCITGKLIEYKILSFDIDILEQAIIDFIDKNPSILNELKSDKKVINHIIGKIIKTTKGKYSSGLVAKKVKEIIDLKLTKIEDS